VAALAARPSASVLRPVIAAAAPGVVVAVITAAVVPPVEVVAVAIPRTLVLIRIGSRIGSWIGSRIVVLLRPPLLRPVPGAVLPAGVSWYGFTVAVGALAVVAAAAAATRAVGLCRRSRVLRSDGFE